MDFKKSQRKDMSLAQTQAISAEQPATRKNDSDFIIRKRQHKYNSIDKHDDNELLSPVLKLPN